jgi:hypothetical protein
MNFTQTKHAQIRSAQRGFTPVMQDIILSFGEPVRRQGGLTEYHLTRKAVGKIYQAMDKAKHKCVLLDEASGEIVTVYNKMRGAS